MEMLPKSVRMARYELLKYLFEETEGWFYAQAQAVHGMRNDHVLTKRLAKAVAQYNFELKEKLKKLQKYLPENHVDFDDPDYWDEKFRNYWETREGGR